ncbi:MAG: OmpA family protein [Prevotella sp.]|uniref:OmpA family protein n=1 Tax=Prevotella sp. TaxID=59823 RepID=UPI002A272A64|nr:OmpA family protein [Prevotella sp.]MDD7317814.1 OmpA family protein [Prevotellaceae bacterium]MDY4020729.1 OmpA family protein [Prevotella sp.]
MKKYLIALAFATVSVAGYAQDSDANNLKYSVATNSFWDNWFIQLGGQYDVFYSGQEHGLNMGQSLAKGFRGNFEASAAIGKWFTPGLGLRIKASGVWGRTVGTFHDNNNYYIPNGKFTYTRDMVSGSKGFKFWTGQGQVMFNLSNMFLGYNPNRVWNFIPFAGAGIARNCTTNRYAMGLGVGILNQFNISKRVAINVEAGWNRWEADFDGVYTSVDEGNRGWDSHDNVLYAEVGLTINVGKVGWNAIPDVDAIRAGYESRINDLNNIIRDRDAEIDSLKKIKPETIRVENKAADRFVATPISVFFNIDKTEIAELKDLVNVRALADYAKDTDSNLLVTGYADSATGTPKRNQWLSEKRAERVANELVKMGIKENKIRKEAKGGVKILSPISYDRRATVQVVK